MEMQGYIDEIKLKLTGDVVSMELTDTTLIKIVNSSLREIQRYIDIPKLITVPFSKCIDLSEYRPSSVSRIYRSEGYLGDTTSEPSIDPMYASQWQLLHGIGNINKLQDFAYNYASWNTLLQIRNTTSTDLAFRYDKASNLLYINVSGNIPQNITVEYIPQYKDVSEIVSDYWQDVLLRLAIANTKIAVGRVRSKFKQSNALWTLDGESLLQEGTTELTSLREELKGSTQLCYPID